MWIFIALWRTDGGGSSTGGQVGLDARLAAEQVARELKRHSLAAVGG